MLLHHAKDHKNYANSVLESFCTRRSSGVIGILRHDTMTGVIRVNDSYLKNFERKQEMTPKYY